MPSPRDLRSWFDAHLHLLKLERLSEKAEFDLLTSEKVKRGQTKLLEKMGISIGGLGVRNTNIGLGGKTIVELERPAQYHTDPKLPYHTLRSGVPVGIIGHDVGSSKSTKKNSTPDKMTIVEGVVSKVTETSISVTIKSSKEDNDQLELPGRCRLIKLADTATFDRLEQTMEQLRDACENAGLSAPCSEEEVKLQEKSASVNESASKFTNITNITNIDFRKVEKFGATDTGLNQVSTNSPKLDVGESTVSNSRTSQRKSPVTLSDLMRVLLGIDKIKMNAEDIKQINIPQTLHNLNLSQQYAVKHALSPCPVTLVFGPPGTGKTHTLVSIVNALYARGDRIIIAAASNLAIDNIAERLLDLKLPITRLGHPARVLDSLSCSTLEYQVNNSEESEIIRELKKEINGNLSKLSAQGKDKLRGKSRALLYKEVQDLRKDYRHRERGHTQNIIKSARIVCATAHGAGSRQLENVKFDVVIIDESTQAFEAACWIPIVKAKSKLILAGDPLQLPPTVKSMKPSSSKTKNSKTDPKISKKKDKKEEKVERALSSAEGQVGEDKPLTDVKSDSDDPEPEMDKLSLKSSKKRPLMKKPRSLETTMFDRLRKYYPEISCLLNVQYRMNQLIMKFPSDELYESKLKAADMVASHLLKDLPNVTREETDGIVDPVLFIDTSGAFMFDRDAEEDGEGSLMNENEADLVVKRVKSLIESGILESQIMVISPYAAQVSLLNSLLKPQYPSLAIGSIDSCQGRENEAVIISLCRSNEEGVVGFLSEKRRLNVAMTRAKRHLTVIGDSDTLSKGGDFLKNWMNWLEDNAEVRVANS